MRLAREQVRFGKDGEPISRWVRTLNGSWCAPPQVIEPLLELLQAQVLLFTPEQFLVIHERRGDKRRLLISTAADAAEWRRQLAHLVRE